MLRIIHYSLFIIYYSLFIQHNSITVFHSVKRSFTMLIGDHFKKQRETHFYTVELSVYVGKKIKYKNKYKYKYKYIFLNTKIICRGFMFK